MTVKVTKDNIPLFRKALQELNSKKVKVGLLASAGPDNIKKGVKNEFGVPSKNVPERSFIRTTFNDEKNKVANRFEQVLESIQRGNFEVDKKLKAIGIEHEGKVKQKITDIRTPPNAPLTIALKGFDNPLIETGEMRSKIASTVIKK